MSGVLAILGGSQSASGFKVVLTRTVLFGTKIGLPGTAQTGFSTTATISGGKPPYTGVWSKVSGDTEIGNTDSGITTKFAAYFTLDDIYVATWKYTATDALGAVADSNVVTVQLQGAGNVS